MRALILADIHANLEALRAVLEDAERRGRFDVIWCLGDTVGYGPDPVPCLDLLRQHSLVAVAGNHDHAAVGKRTVEDFNYAAAAAARWTAGQLTSEASAFLASLPSVATAEPFTLVHGTLRDPISEYLLNQDAARSTFQLLRTRYCLVGHSHLPFLCLEEVPASGGQFVEFPEDQPFELGEQRCVINPGCVGQPRDRDPRPSYALYDSQPSPTGRMTIARHRVAYNISDTQQKMRLAGLPQVLIDRLDHGW